MKNIAAVTAAWARSQGMRVDFRASVASTNDLAREDSTFDLYVCEHQTAGRGRGSHTWSDTGGGQLLASWNWVPRGIPQPMITPRLGLGLYRAAVSTWFDAGWSLKAPNDLFLGGKKVAGLLIEAVTQGNNVRIVIGLGLNVTSTPELPRATSMAQHFSAAVLNERSFLDFLSRWHLEMKLISNSSDEVLASHDHTALAGALQKCPLAPRVVALREDGTIEYEDKTTKKWMEL